jgi:hypothetical protein
MNMNDNKQSTPPESLPVCPIPDDAKIGDIVVFRDGQRREIEKFLDVIHVKNDCPGGLHRSGHSWVPGDTDWDCIGFIRKSKPKPKKPAKVERVWNLWAAVKPDGSIGIQNTRKLARSLASTWSGQDGAKVIRVEVKEIRK